MIYYLGEYLQDLDASLSFMRLVDSISFRALCGALTSLLFTILFGNRIILYFYRLGHRDMPRNYLNFSSVGNPSKTYGGPLLVAAILLSIVLWCKVHTGFVLLCLGGVLFFAGLGWIDDFLKVRHRDSDHGLSEVAKLALQGAYCTVFGIVYVTADLTPLPPDVATQLYVPFLKYPLFDLSLLYIPFIVFTITAISNSVNIADGVDGLAVVPTAFVIAVFGVFAYISATRALLSFSYFPLCPASVKLLLFAQLFLERVWAFYGLIPIRLTLSWGIRDPWLWGAAGHRCRIGEAGISISDCGGDLCCRGPIRHHTGQDRC